MRNKISNFVLLILLILLQSCSGGKLGNFLESSFKYNNSNKISQSDNNEELKSNIIVEDKKLVKKTDKIIKRKLSDENKPLNFVDSSSMKINDEKVIKKRNLNYKPKSYRIFVILKKVDPSFPTENFSKALRNGDIDFEIEKIELIPEINQNKK
tara:strand:+ start:198 stop:659 length:462 start_codon:yes stop_codon:yes gene_type:complete